MDGGGVVYPSNQLKPSNNNNCFHCYAPFVRLTWFAITHVIECDKSETLIISSKHSKFPQNMTFWQNWQWQPLYRLDCYLTWRRQIVQRFCTPRSSHIENFYNCFSYAGQNSRKCSSSPKTISSFWLQLLQFYLPFIYTVSSPSVCSGSVVVTAYDFESGNPGSNPEWGPIYYEASITAQGLPEPSSLRGSTLSTRAAEHKGCNWTCKWLMVAA